MRAVSSRVLNASRGGEKLHNTELAISALDRELFFCTGTAARAASTAPRAVGALRRARNSPAACVENSARQYENLRIAFT